MKRTIYLVLGMLMVAAVTTAQVQTTNQQSPMQIEQSLANRPGIDPDLMTQMQTNLEKCVALGMGTDQVNLLFDVQGNWDNERAREMLARQQQILTMSEQGLPTSPMLDKMSEGHMKNIPMPQMDRVLDQVQANIQTAHTHMMQALAGGVSGSQSPAGLQQANSDLARCLWDGLQESDLSTLGEHARMRAQNSNCDMSDYVAASQAATRFMGSGMDHDQAVNMAGDAIMQGYSPEQMGTMGSMMMASDDNSEHHQEMMAQMQTWVHDGMSWDEMTEHMIEGGWMGPADMMGPGGCNPMDNMGMSGPGHDGGMMGGGDHDHDGMGGGDGGGMGGGHNS